MSKSPERTMIDAFVELSDTLVADFDVLEFLHLLARRCVDLLGVQAAGIMVADQRGSLRVMASSSERAHLLELFEVETDQGPCVACYTSAAPVADPDLDAADPRWPQFADRARQAGFRAVHAFPVRLRNEVIGVLNLFAAAPGTLGDATAQAARGLSNIATMGLLQHRAVEYRQVLAEQLQHAMNSRVLIEQAKGVLAERLGLDMADAFDELRRYAARLGRRLSDAAAAVAVGDHGPTMIDSGERLRVLLIRRFDRDSLAALRAAISATVSRHGTSDPQTRQFVLAVHEAATNAVRHGGGTGQLLLWLHAGNLHAEVSDHGTGIPDQHRQTPTRPSNGDGRGLPLIRRICTDIDIDTGNTGTRLLMRYRLDGTTMSGTDPTGE